MNPPTKEQILEAARKSNQMQRATYEAAIKKELLATLKERVEKMRKDPEKIRLAIYKEHKNEKDAWERATNVGAFFFPHNIVVDDVLIILDELEKSL